MRGWVNRTQVFPGLAGPENLHARPNSRLMLACECLLPASRSASPASIFCRTKICCITSSHEAEAGNLSINRRALVLTLTALVLVFIDSTVPSFAHCSRSHFNSHIPMGCPCRMIPARPASSVTAARPQGATASCRPPPPDAKMASLLVVAAPAKAWSLAPEAPRIPATSPWVGRTSPQVHATNPRIEVPAPEFAPSTPGLAGRTPGFTPVTPGWRSHPHGLTPPTPGLAGRAPGLVGRTLGVTPSPLGSRSHPHGLAPWAPGLAAPAPGFMP